MSKNQNLVSGQLASNHRQPDSQQPSTQVAESLDFESYQGQSQISASGRPRHQSHRTSTENFVISEDQEDETSNTQDTSGSTSLSQRNLNSQSQVDIVAKEQPGTPFQESERFSKASARRISDQHPSESIIKMSETNPSVPTQNPPRILSLLDKRTKLRAESRAREASFSLDDDFQDAQKPVSPRRSPKETLRKVLAVKPDRPETPRPAHKLLPMKDLSGKRPKSFSVANGLSPSKPNGSSSEQHPISAQVSIAPQPQMYTTPEQQTRFLVRPMSVPAVVPLAVRPQPNGQPLPSAIYNAPRRQEFPNTTKTRTLKPLGCDSNEHIISLAMNTRVRDQYTSTINLYRDAVMKLMDSDSPDDDCGAEITKLLTRISLTLQHSDLDAQETLEESSQPSPEDEAKWAEQCSFKFQFLRHFLEEIRRYDIHVSIVAQPGRLLNILETFLKGRKIIYFRPDTNVSIVPSGLEWRNLAVKPAALVIGFDGSAYVSEPQVHRMRMQEELDWLRPVVRLMVYKSAEHLALCLPADNGDFDRTRKIVAGMTQLRHEVGVLQPEDMEVSAAAEEVAIALRLSGHPRFWTLPADGSQLSQEQQAPFQSSTLKRAWDNSVSTDSSEAKRQRMSQDISHIDNLLNDHANLASENENLKAKVNRLTTSHKALEAQLATNTRANKQLFSQSLSTQSTHQTHLSDLEASLSDLQTRYEDKDRAYKDLHLSLSDLDTSLTKAVQKLEAQSIELTTLKAAKKQLEIDLEQSRKDLLTTETPDLNRIAVAESAARAAVAENELLKKKITNLTSDLDFTRSAYQTASTSAAELAAQVTSLTSELETAQRKASGEAARLAQINKDNAVKEARKENRQLKSMMEERERVCRRKEEEIVELKGRRGRGGLGTRGGSVQPGVGGGGVGQGKSPRGSRGGSPLPGVGVGVGGEGMRRGGSGLRGEVV
ncbi:MAG: hypothetical protein Q9182_006014 [Xanthomendoza sp. 2 TL-2023]